MSDHQMEEMEITIVSAGSAEQSQSSQSSRIKRQPPRSKSPKPPKTSTNDEPSEARSIVAVESNCEYSGMGASASVSHKIMKFIIACVLFVLFITFATSVATMVLVASDGNDNDHEIDVMHPTNAKDVPSFAPEYQQAGGRSMAPDSVDSTDGPSAITGDPSQESVSPTLKTVNPSQPPQTAGPSDNPSQTPNTDNPSAVPSDNPSQTPNTELPSDTPSQPPQTGGPSNNPSQTPNTQLPSDTPSESPHTGYPSDNPSEVPSNDPSQASDNPSQESLSPTLETGSPSDNPSRHPTITTGYPSGYPSWWPTGYPSNYPSDYPIPNLPQLSTYVRGIDEWAAHLGWITMSANSQGSSFDNQDGSGTAVFEGMPAGTRVTISMEVDFRWSYITQCRDCTRQILFGIDGVQKDCISFPPGTTSLRNTFSFSFVSDGEPKTIMTRGIQDKSNDCSGVRGWRVLNKVAYVKGCEEPNIYGSNWNC